MYKFLIFSTLLIISIRSFSQSSVSKLNDKTEFNNFSGVPLTEKYGQVSAIKVVYDIYTKSLYFINSKHFKYHYNFCSHHLNDEVDIEYFNSLNYSNHPKRKYLLATINYFKPLNTYALEISPVDLMSANDLLFLHKIIVKSTFLDDSLSIFLNSARLQSLRNEFVGKVRILHPSDIYKNLNYQAIGKFKNCGILRFISNEELENNEINPMDIVVLDETPLFLPKLSGLLVTEFQTPLSHLTILGQNRKIPIAAYKTAFQDTALRMLHNKKVCLEVLTDSFTIKSIDTLKPFATFQRKIKLKYNLDVDSIIGIEHVSKKSFKYTGNKAANFGTLYQLSKKYDFSVPECAFVIPFHFYNSHIANSPTKQLIDSLLNQQDEIYRDSLTLLLEAIRKGIKTTPIDSQLINSINKKVISCGNYSRIRFRSSTNAEDSEGFSGAGLYSSKTGIYNNNKKSFEKAIKKVWASLWSLEAYSEREYYNIAHKDVYMGILVHRSFPDEAVNGVAITKNLYRPNDSGFVVNAQLGNESVVQPKQGITADQFICYPDNEDSTYKNIVDIITQSNLNKDVLIMSDSEIQHLSNQLELIKKYYFDHTFTPKQYIDFGLDIEFKLNKKNRKLYIKQVRPYNN